MFDSVLQGLSQPVVWLPTVVCVLALCAYQHYVNVYTYWERRNVKGIKPIIPILPEIWNVLTKNNLKLARERAKKYGKIYGSFILGNPQLVVCDPEVIRQITIKDFDSFQDHQTNPWQNKYEKHFLIRLQGEHWRRVRALMTPSFTSGKIKRMYRLLEGCASDLVLNFEEQIKDQTNKMTSQQKAIIDLYETVGMYTMDGITTCCYGVKLKREKNVNLASSRNAFVRDADGLFKFNLKRFFIVSFTPSFILKRLNIKMVPEAKLKPFADRVEMLIEKRRRGIGHKYDDLLQSLLDATLDDELELGEMDTKENHHAGLTSESLISDQAKLKSTLTSDKEEQNDGKQQQRQVAMSQFEILSEAMFLLAAGLDTTRASLSTICYFLAHNQHVQDRLYSELKQIASSTNSANGNSVGEDRNLNQSEDYTFDYDALTSCDYLDAVISETLRMFGPVPMIDRVASNDHHMSKYNIDLAKGSRLLLGFQVVHNDPDYWNEPARFDPDRFMPGQREKIVPGSYLPFSMGPRHCIGMRFSLTETKLGLAKLVMNFKFEPAPGTEYPPSPSFGMGLISVRNCRTYVSRRNERPRLL